MPWRRTIELHVDRDSVAMRDAMSHARTTTVPRGTLLSAAIEQCSPEIKHKGGRGAPSWRRRGAVWSVDRGARLLVADYRLTQGGGRYPLPLLRSDVRELVHEYSPIAREKHRSELCRRKREIDARLLTSQCIVGKPRPC